MEFIPDSYKDIPLGTYEENACSPEIPSPTWSGIIISGPQRINLNEDDHPVIPVCGYYLVPVLDAMDGPPMSVHVNRIDSDVILSGEVAEEGDNEPLASPPPNAPRPSREAFEGVSTGGYFNIDAQRYLKPRLIPGSYEVTVSFAGGISNPILIEIVLDTIAK